MTASPAPARRSVRSTQVSVIERRPGWQMVDFRELWHYREMLYYLVWRDIKVRYKQTVLGVAWAILQPLSITTVLSLFLGDLARFSVGQAPYPLYVLCGLIPWTFFANAISHSSQSVVGSYGLITKVYFPRIIIPVAAVATALVDVAIASLALAGLMMYFDWPIDLDLVWAPMIMAGLGLAAAGIGILLSALTVAYRDFRHVVPFMVQLWMFATPVIYMRFDLDANPRWTNVLSLNPAFGYITNFRAAVLGYEWHFPSLIIGITVSLFLFALGCFYFRRVERSFADII